jgi:hypothetical protein
LPRYPRFGRFRACLVACILLASLPVVVLAEPDEIVRLTFAQLVNSIRADSEVTQPMASHNGKEVEIRGFIIPAGPPDLSFFMLSRVSALGNYCCEVPVGQDETVYVFAKDVHVMYDPLRIYQVRGVFEAGMRSEPATGPSMFRLRQAHVEAAVGAVVFKVGEAGPAKP